VFAIAHYHTKGVLSYLQVSKALAYEKNKEVVMSEKSLLEILIVPLAICGIGYYATITTNDTQIKNANNLNHTQISSSSNLTNSQIKSAETLADTQANRSRINHLELKDLQITNSIISKLSTTTGCKLESEINLLITMATPKQSEKLEKLYLIKCSIDKKSDIAISLNKSVIQSRKNEILNIISELSGDNRRSARVNLSSIYMKN